MEFDRESFYVKERYNEVYLGENEDGEPTDLELSTKEKKGPGPRDSFWLDPRSPEGELRSGARQGMGQLAEVRRGEGVERVGEPGGTAGVPEDTLLGLQSLLPRQVRDEADRRGGGEGADRGSRRP